MGEFALLRPGVKCSSMFSVPIGKVLTASGGVGLQFAR